MGNFKHGHSRVGNVTPTYRRWLAMHQRCVNSSLADYDIYGGRGIRVCERWQSFENFLADMGEQPDGKSLDRYPDTNGNYEPGNVRWADPKQQARNKRNNLLMTFRGQTLCQSEWAESLGIHKETLRKRLAMGWSVEKAFLTPIRPKRASATQLSPTSPAAVQASV
jgi:hypothetical protein